MFAVANGFIKDVVAAPHLSEKTRATIPEGRPYLAPSTCAAIEGASATKAKRVHSDRPT